MTKLVEGLLILFVLTLLSGAGYLVATKIKAEEYKQKHGYTPFYHYKLLDDGNMELYKRTVVGDALVTCYWVKNPKGRLVFHSCKHETKYD